MATGYKILPPSGGRSQIISAETFDGRMDAVRTLIDRYGSYCDQNWLNDNGDVISPEIKIKGFLDRLAYFLLIGNTDGIITDYRRDAHNAHETPASCCPAYVENVMYGDGAVSDDAEQDEAMRFNAISEKQNEKIEKYRTVSVNKKRRKSLFSKRIKNGIVCGEWCYVDTNNEFVHDGHKYRIHESVKQYAPIETDIGLLYDMDRILIANNGYYDMNFDSIPEEMITIY